MYTEWVNKVVLWAAVNRIPVDIIPYGTEHVTFEKKIKVSDTNSVLELGYSTFDGTLMVWRRTEDKGMALDDFKGDVSWVENLLAITPEEEFLLDDSVKSMLSQTTQVRIFGKEEE